MRSALKIALQHSLGSIEQEIDDLRMMVGSLVEEVELIQAKVEMMYV